MVLEVGAAKGGLGLRDPVRHAGAAYVARVTKSFDLCRAIDPEFNPTDYGGGLHLAEALAALQSETLEAATVMGTSSAYSKNQLSGMVDAAVKQDLLSTGLADDPT